MATKSEKIAVIRQMHPPVEMTDAELKSMSTDQIDEIIEKRNGVKPAAETAEPDVEIPQKAKAENSVSFVLTDGNRRSFTPEAHGEGFSKVADEFHETNRSRIRSRVDE